MPDEELGLKAKCTIEGDRLCLRPIDVEDVTENYVNWMNNPKVNQFLESRFQPWSKDNLTEFVKRNYEDQDTLFFAIIWKKQKQHVGNIKLGPINRQHAFADIGLVIGDIDFWGMGVATEAISMLVDYALTELGLHKLTAGAYEPNIGSVKAFKKAGFTVEGVKKSQYLFNKDYVDEILLGFTR